MDHFKTYARFPDPPSDHTYLVNSNHFFLNPLTASILDVTEGITNELNSLQNNLPPSTFVRASLTPYWLLRAAMVGGEGTPYNNFLFFFDISMLPNHPAKPPMVWHLCSNMEFHPKLKKNGLVWLALVGYHRESTKRWNPNTSNIGEVMESIRDLLKCERPYLENPAFNDREDKSWDDRVERYNEDIYVNCCKLALSVLRHPPQHFELLVTLHFKDRAVDILTTLNNYRLAPVGTSLHIAGNCRIKVSGRYKGVIETIYADLVRQLYDRYGGLVYGFIEGMAVAEPDDDEERPKKKKKTSLWDSIRVFTGLKKKED